MPSSHPDGPIVILSSELASPFGGVHPELAEGLRVNSAKDLTLTGVQA
jgi:hypothetical protein